MQALMPSLWLNSALISTVYYGVYEYYPSYLSWICTLGNLHEEIGEDTEGEGEPLYIYLMNLQTVSR